MSTTTLSELDDKVKRRWKVRTPEELGARCKEVGLTDFIIDDLIPDRSLSMLVGDSGLGKSPWLYQAAICVAQGRPFLNKLVDQRRVLYLDFEDGILQVHATVKCLSHFLGLQGMPEELLLLNYNDSPVSWDQFPDLIRDVKPGLVIVDPLTALDPTVEDSNSAATEFYKRLRRIIREHGCSILGSHHRKKDQGPRRGVQPAKLEGDNYKKWFQDARGAGVLINGADSRLGVEGYITRTRTEQGKHAMGIESEAETGLLLRGYARGTGEIPLMRACRILSKETGEPIGYQLVTGAHLLNNPDQEQAYTTLPARFSFKEAKSAYGRGDQPTTNFLNKCITLGILQKVAHGLYTKLNPVGVHEAVEREGLEYVANRA